MSLPRPLASVMLITALATAPLACAPRGAWHPTLSPGLETHSAVPEQAFDDGCSLRWESLLVGVPSAGLLDDQGERVASTPGQQAFDLLGSGGTILAEPRAPAGDAYGSFELHFGAPGEVEEIPYEGRCGATDCGDDNAASDANVAHGTASPEQRRLLNGSGDGGQVRGVLRCGEASASFEIPLPPGVVRCELDHWSLKGGGAGSTWVVLAFERLFAAELDATEATPPLLGEPWLLADGDGDGRLDPEELEDTPAASVGLDGTGSLAARWLRQASTLAYLDGQLACGWEGDAP